MLFVIRMRLPPLHPPTCCSALTCHATIARSVLHHTLLMACFKVTGTCCCERGRREVASVGAKDRRSLIHILSSFHILRLTLILVPLLSPFFSLTNMSAARFIASQHSAFPLVSLITSVFRCLYLLVFLYT